VTNVRAFLGLTNYYRNYVKGYSRIAIPLFDLTKKDNVFSWNPTIKIRLICCKLPWFQLQFWLGLISQKHLILDVDWSTCRVGAILSQKDARNERVIAYVSKRFTPIQKKFHLMEGECYALVY
jgi:hypothetical protein